MILSVMMMLIQRLIHCDDDVGVDVDGVDVDVDVCADDDDDDGADVDDDDGILDVFWRVISKSLSLTDRHQTDRSHFASNYPFQ